MDRTFASVREEYESWAWAAQMADTLSIGAPVPVTPEDVMRAYVDIMEAGMYDAKPCLDCGTTGGALRGNYHQPLRARGLCSACYSKHQGAGTLEQFSLSSGYGPHPQPVPARVELTRPRYALPWGAPSNPAWDQSIARDNARTWATAAWVGRSEAA